MLVMWRWGDQEGFLEKQHVQNMFKFKNSFKKKNEVGVIEMAS